MLARIFWAGQAFQGWRAAFARVVPAAAFLFWRILIVGLLLLRMLGLFLLAGHFWFWRILIARFLRLLFGGLLKQERLLLAVLQGSMQDLPVPIFWVALALLPVRLAAAWQLRFLLFLLAARFLLFAFSSGKGIGGWQQATQALRLLFLALVRQRQWKSAFVAGAWRGLGK